jgi:hypothetical protein
MQSFGPLAGILGAALASLSVFKWVLFGFVVIVILWVMSSQQKSKNALDSRAIRDLVKSASQWKTRSIQDSNVVISLMNANYAMAYFNVARSIGTDADVESHANISIDEFMRDLENVQSAAIHKISTSCPVASIKHANTGWT